MKVYLNASTCTSNYDNPITYATPHYNTQSPAACTGLTRGANYQPHLEQWWNSDDPDLDNGYQSGDTLRIPMDDDNDGVDDTTDCDDHFYDPYNSCDYDSFCGVTAEDVRTCETQQDAHWYDYYQWGPGTDPVCECEPGASPIIINLDDGPLQLTAFAKGVWFDLSATGTPWLVAWTRSTSRAGFLALDRNGDGAITNGKELFGNVTDQPPLLEREQRNGFRALAVFDEPSRGGDGDGLISERDSVFDRLRLWVDMNHDGVSQSNELLTMTQSGIDAISVRYRTMRYRDDFGNQFRFRGEVVMAAAAGRRRRGATDVFLGYAK